MGGAVWMRARAEMRRRWVAWLVIGILVGATSGAAMAAAAGARRTESAYPRFLERQRAADVLADIRYQRTGEPLAIADVLRLPRVADAAHAVLIPAEMRTAGGRVLTFPDVFPVAAIDGRFGVELNKTHVLRGRAARQDRADEVSVSHAIADRFGVRVGDVLTMRVVEDPTSGRFRPEERLRVVGIVVMPGDFQPLAGASIPAVHLTRSFYEKLRSGQPAAVVRLRGGASDVQAMIEGSAAQGVTVRAFFEQREQTQTVQQSTRFQAVALWLVAVLTALAGAATFGQALVRHAFFEAQDYPVLRAIGMSRAQHVAIGIVRAAAISLVALLVGASIAIAASPLTPVGLARIAESNIGIWVDWTVLAIGAAAVCAFVFGASVLAQARTAYAPVGAGPLSRAQQPSRFASLVARLGGSAASVAGVRLALEPGRGRTAVPVRSTIVAAALGVVALTAGATFGASLDHLIRTPALSGWTFDLLVGGPPHELQQVRSILESKRILRSWTEGGVPAIAVCRLDSLDGERRCPMQAEAIDAAIALPPGDTRAAIADGSPPSTALEIALGRDTMRRLGVSIGQRVAVAKLIEESPSGTAGPAPAGPTTTMLVTGRLVMPSLGFNLGNASEGAAIAMDGWKAIDPGMHPTSRGVFVGLAASAQLDPVVESLRRDVPGIFVAARREGAAVRDLARISGVPVALAGILILIAVATLIHTLLTSIHRRRHDLAILKTVGFVRGQVRAAVAWQASTIVGVALLIGIPVGLAGGRWGWLFFADALGVVPVAVVRVLIVAAAVAAPLVLANVVAAFPARAAARTEPAGVLRAE